MPAALEAHTPKEIVEWWITNGLDKTDRATTYAQQRKETMALYEEAVIIKPDHDWSNA